jgi:carbon-monoxide dehydrogenase medium subunit
MKSPEFDYIKVRTIEHALSLLASHGDEARVLAGGQSLLPALNMRLSEPSLLIDIGGIDALRGIQVTPRALRIGALTTHTDIENSALVAQHAPLLKLAVGHIAHRAIRNSGTWGGSIANADPAAEWPCCLLALDGTVIVQGPQGERWHNETTGSAFKNSPDAMATTPSPASPCTCISPARWFNRLACLG